MEQEIEVRKIIRKILNEAIYTVPEEGLPILTTTGIEKAEEATNLNEKALEEKPKPQGVDKIMEKINEKLK